VTIRGRPGRATVALAVALAAGGLTACGRGEPRVSGAVPAAVTTGDRIVFVVLGGDETEDPPGTGSLTRAWEQLVYASLPTSAVLIDLADRRPTARAVISEQLPRAQALHPTVATLWLGVGDTETGTTETVFADRTEQIVTGLQQAGARTVILLSRRVPDPNAGTGTDPADTTEPSLPGDSRRYAAALDAVAARTGAVVVPLPGDEGPTQAEVAAAVRPRVSP
jgi:hypothetical protein